MNEIIETLENIERQLHEAAEDAMKFNQGNNSAGTRVRRACRTLKV